MYLSGPLKYKGQIYLLSHQTFMLELQSITGVIVIDLIINYYNSSEAVNVQRHGREFDGILPNIRLSMPNDEYKSPQQSRLKLLRSCGILWPSAMMGLLDVTSANPKRSYNVQVCYLLTSHVN